MSIRASAGLLASPSVLDARDSRDAPPPSPFLAAMVDRERPATPPPLITPEAARPRRARRDRIPASLARRSHQNRVDGPAIVAYARRGARSLSEHLQFGCPSMIASLEPVGDVVIVCILSRELEIGNADELELELRRISGVYAKVVLDLGKVAFVDSSGCRVIFSAYRELSSRHGALALCRVAEPVRNVFEIVRLHRYCSFHATREAAIAALSAP